MAFFFDRLYIIFTNRIFQARKIRISATVKRGAFETFFGRVNCPRQPVAFVLEFAAFEKRRRFGVVEIVKEHVADRLSAIAVVATPVLWH